MGYVRPARKEELEDWLTNRFLNEDGHIFTTAEQLAEALTEAFDVVGPFNTAA